LLENKEKDMQRTLSLKRSVWLLGASFIIACGGDDEPEIDGHEDGGHQHEDAGDDHEDAGDDHEEAGGDQQEVDAGSKPDAETKKPASYVFATQVFAGENANTYLVGSDKIETGSISTKEAHVVPGRAIVASPGDGRYFYVGSDKSPVVTRYELAAGGKLVAGDEVSFAGKGVASIGEYQTQFQFVSESKAYYFDAKSAQAVVWNPKTMKVTGSIDLKALSSTTHVLAFASTPTRRGAEVIMPVGFRSLDNRQIVDGAAVVIIDSKDDSFKIARDERCGYVRDAVTTKDDVVYVATEAYGSAVNRLASANGPAPCLLRIPADTQEFDKDFHVGLNELAGGKTVGSLALLPSGKVYTKVLDESLTMIGAMTSARALASAASWTWAELSLGDTPTLTPDAKLPATAGSIIWFAADQTLLVAEFVNFSESTKLRDIGAGKGDVVASSEGLLFSVAQLR
jgi:hypothetical protein